MPSNHTPYQIPVVKLGNIRATVAVANIIYEAKEPVRELLQRHQYGDWGDVSPQQAALNDHHLIQGDAVRSIHTLQDVQLAITTLGDPPITVISLPVEDCEAKS